MEKVNIQFGKIVLSIIAVSILFISLISTQEQMIAGPLKSGNAVLSNPSPISPASGTVFNRYPRRTLLRWSPVKGAASYMVEVEYQDTKWEPFIQKSTGKATRFEFEFVGKQLGRWRVWAVGSDGTEGRKSSWWIFKYTK